MIKVTRDFEDFRACISSLWSLHLANARSFDEVGSLEMNEGFSIVCAYLMNAFIFKRSSSCYGFIRNPLNGVYPFVEPIDFFEIHAQGGGGCFEFDPVKRVWLEVAIKGQVLKYVDVFDFDNYSKIREFEFIRCKSIGGGAELLIPCSQTFELFLPD